MIARPCTGCGTVIPTGSRCPACRPTTRKPTGHVHSNPARWKTFSKKIRRNSPYCEWCGSPDRLQADHVIPIAVAPELAYATENCRVLCKPCNGQRQDNYTTAEATDVLTRLQATHKRRPTRAGHDRITAAENALRHLGSDPRHTGLPSAGKPQRAMNLTGVKT